MPLWLGCAYRSAIPTNVAEMPMDTLHGFISWLVWFSPPMSPTHPDLETYIRRVTRKSRGNHRPRIDLRDIQRHTRGTRTGVPR